MTDTPKRGLLALILLTTGVLAGDRWAARTRATRAEKRQPVAGDEIVTAPDWQATRAVDIDCPPGDVWPWIVQMGHPSHRAGWYAPYYLDRLVWRVRDRSSDELRPELQQLAVGDRIPDSPDGSVHFDVVALEPQRHMVLLSTTHLLPPYKDLVFSWAFQLQPLAGGDRTRVLMRARTTFTPVWPAPAVRLFLRLAMDPGDAVEAGSMLLGLKRRVERQGPA